MAVVMLVNDLLLVMIIMEVLRTLLSYLQERATSSAKFREVIIDLGANAGAILAIAIALYSLARRPTNE